MLLLTEGSEGGGGWMNSERLLFLEVGMCETILKISSISLQDTDACRIRQTKL